MPSCVFPSLPRLRLHGALTYLQVGGRAGGEGKGGMGPSLVGEASWQRNLSFPLSWAEFGWMGFGTDLWAERVPSH